MSAHYAESVAGLLGLLRPDRLPETTKFSKRRTCLNEVILQRHGEAGALLRATIKTLSA